MMTLEECTEKINKFVDEQLVALANNPSLRGDFELPSLVDGYQGETYLTCFAGTDCVGALREVVSAQYYLHAMGTGLLARDKESLFACLRNLRKVPLIDFYDWAEYHKLAAAYYTEVGNTHKAALHQWGYLVNQSKADIEQDTPVSYLPLLEMLQKDSAHFKAVLLYILHFIGTELKENSKDFYGAQYLLLEQALQLAVNQFAENETCEDALRGCIYYYQGLFYKFTNRPKLMEVAEQHCMQLGDGCNYETVCASLLASLPALRPSVKDWIDYTMHYYNVQFEGGYQTSFVYDGFYRPALMAQSQAFRKAYDAAENGNAEAIREVVRCYQEGEGVTACKAAAEAWENQA